MRLLEFPNFSDCSRLVVLALRQPEILLEIWPTMHVKVFEDVVLIAICSDVSGRILVRSHALACVAEACQNRVGLKISCRSNRKRYTRVRSIASPSDLDLGDIAAAPDPGFVHHHSWRGKYLKPCCLMSSSRFADSRSSFIISRTRLSKEVWGCQPSFSFAFEGSPSKVATSVGRK